MKTYDKYKPSSVDCIGNIPVDWEVKKLKYETNLVIDGTHFTPTYIDEGVPFLRVTDIHLQTINLDKVKRISVNEHKELSKRCNPEKGDLLLSKNGTIGITKVIDWDWEFSVFVSLCLIKFKKTLNPVFFSYMFSSDATDQQINEGSKKTSVTNLHLDKIRELLVVVPPIEEQTAIADYLDEKTEQIDKLIANKQRLIELLKEERTAIINQAVTKGINPDAKLKPSGIDWLGDIPEHWEIKKLKYLVSKVGSGVTPSGGANVYQEEGIPLLRSQNIYFDGLRLDDVAYISEEIDESMSNSRVKENDVLLNITGASIGRCFYVPKNFGKGNVNQHVCIIRPIENVVETKYLHSVLSSGYGQNLIDLCQTGANREGLNFQQIKSFDIPFCKIEEQKEIVKFIESKTNEIDSTISKIEKEIELIKEYRTALISEVVTGKIEVKRQKAKGKSEDV